MKKNSFIHQALWLLCYVSLLLFYVFELSKNDFFKASIQDLEKILGPTTLDIRLFLIIISVVFSVISLLIEYFLSKFLVLLFIQNGTVSFIDVIISKLVVIIINFFALLLMLPVSSLYQFLINALGILIMYLLSVKRQGRKVTAILFCLPFMVDILITLMF
ncbi:hypothetical protein [Streptococcus sp.]|uniref:hypothetical protein n=1 Tax=Streptococcus sp. TaxID=1306 RepID=UPI00183C2762|nr:hypothetical protein [Streptococcus sp.]HHU65140.1 hypothetical protein [Streptococcus sp.]